MNDGGPAFPIPIAATIDANGEQHVIDSQDRCVGGMSLRDYFAAKAMQSYMDRLSVEQDPLMCKEVASEAYSIADAMLAERSKSK